MKNMTVSFFIFGIACLAIGLITGSAYLFRKRRCTRQTTGKVVSIETVSNVRYTLLCLHIVYEAEGEDARLDQRIPANRSKYREGDSVRVWYDPLRPGRCYLEDAYTMHANYRAELIGGAAALCLAGLCSLFGR